MTYAPAVLKLSSNFVVGKGNLEMKRIDIRKCKNETYYHFTHGMKEVAEGINEIMDFLETHLPIKKEKNGLIWSCTNCGHATAYLGDLGKCCEKPLYEVSP